MKQKTLHDLTSEEIGQLFPVEISTYSNHWPQLYEQEKELMIKNIDPDLFSNIEHFGSTSVPGLSAKNTIDILMEVEFEDAKNDRLIQQMQALGYEFNWQNEGPNTHMVFAKGYMVNQPKSQTYHVHAGPKNHPLWDRAIFRDYLIKHPETAKAYADLKLKLAGEYRHQRVAYRIAKTDFVTAITQKAKQELL
ncbi:GrpB family protein [Mucilaginibacter terrae]|uniref:GrpB-like predicted nucleotidyltransferase (UPF0157 family) n=1 Tax=Mucilaginibacter terrae TaxID=1955052 RepID=A0ABU3GZG7_9SPHI|nr:GrpB family protein [Mucilaginibacter terrae]MDT3405158.1 GrpB-like predicted nucleotidyltransferase (UPF0157 family) [Mucilaginibacter terrae]